MFNAYVVILGLFVVTGALVSLWGGWIMVQGRRSLSWPQVEGVIVKTEQSSEQDELLPHIEYRYELEQKQYQCRLNFAADISPSPEFSASYVQRYPEGATVAVFYNPLSPEQSTLEPGPGKGDWLVLMIGVVTFFSGLVFLFMEL